MSIQHGFTVQRTGDEGVDRLQQRIKAAFDAIVASATASQLTDNDRWVSVGKQNLQNEVRAPDVTASTSVLAAPGAYQRLAGSSTINFIQSGNWFDGARIEYYILAGLTFNHHAVGGARNAALPLHLLSGAATAKAAGTVIVFRLDYAFNFWIQVQ